MEAVNIVKDRSIFLNRFINKIKKSRKVESWNWKKINSFFINPARRYISKANYARAEKLLLEGFEKSSGDPHVAFWLGELSKRTGRKDEAMIWFRYAKENYPLDKFKRRAEQKLKECSRIPRMLRVESSSKRTIYAPQGYAIFTKEKQETSSWIATVIIQSEKQYTNHSRLRDMLQISDHLSNIIRDNGVILFPGGWLSAGGEKPRGLYSSVEKTLSQYLGKFQKNLIISLGIDGRFSKDQLAISIGKKGIMAIGRKFFPAPRERGRVALACSYLAEEDGKPRILAFNGRHYFLCACYDSFGIRKLGIQNPGVEAILDHVHGFHEKGKGMSGAVYFAKHGFAGASRQWGCPVFGAAVFYKREIPIRWPSCVFWNRGSENTQSWKYSDNPIQPTKEFQIKVSEGIALIRTFALDSCE